MARVLRRRACIALVVALGFAVPRAGVAAADVLNATVSATPVGQTMPTGFVGASFEYRALHLYTGRDPRAVDPALLGLLSGLAPGAVSGDPDRRRQHRRQLVADPRDDSPGRDLLPDHQGLAADDPGAGRRSRRQAHPRHQPGRRAPGDRRRRGPGPDRRYRQQVHRRSGDRQRARPLQRLSLVPGSPRPHLPGPRPGLQPRRLHQAVHAVGAGAAQPPARRPRRLRPELDEWPGHSSSPPSPGSSS